MALPEALAQVVASPAALSCQTKGCKMHHADITLSRITVDRVVSCVPPPPGKRGMTAMWEHKKVMTDLKFKLQDLKPRFWNGSSIDDLCSAVSQHDWYAQ